MTAVLAAGAAAAVVFAAVHARTVWRRRRVERRHRQIRRAIWLIDAYHERHYRNVILRSMSS